MADWGYIQKTGLTVGKVLGADASGNLAEIDAPNISSTDLQINTPTARRMRMNNSLTTNSWGITNSTGSFDFFSIDGSGQAKFNGLLAPSNTSEIFGITGIGNQRFQIFKNGDFKWGLNANNITNRINNGNYWSWNNTGNIAVGVNEGFQFVVGSIGPQQASGIKSGTLTVLGGVEATSTDSIFSLISRSTANDNDRNYYHHDLQNVQHHFRKRGVAIPAPTNVNDWSYRQWCDESIAGNGDYCPHFMTNNGDIIKLFKQQLNANPTNAEIATFFQNLGLAELI